MLHLPPCVARPAGGSLPRGPRALPRGTNVAALLHSSPGTLQGRRGEPESALRCFAGTLRSPHPRVPLGLPGEAVPAMGRSQCCPVPPQVLGFEVRMTECPRQARAEKTGPDALRCSVGLTVQVVQGPWSEPLWGLSRRHGPTAPTLAR